MATQLLPQTPMTAIPSPPLLALPLELKLQILSYLSVDDPDDDDDVSLIILRRTHRSFRNIIPHAPYTSKDRTHNGLQLEQAEFEHPYLIPPLNYPCYQCLRVMEVSAFGRSDVRMHWYSSVLDLGVITPIGSSWSNDRKCNACWDDAGRYIQRLIDRVP